MSKRKKFLLVILLSFTTYLQAQPFGALTGSVIDRSMLRPVVGASVQLSGGYATTTDSIGRFIFRQLAVGSYALKVSSVGYKDYQLYNLVITSGNQNTLNIELETQAEELSEVMVQGSRRTARAATLESPLSVQRLTTEEIRSNPGGNFDISRVIQSLPGCWRNSR